MMNCRRIEELMPLFVEGDLDAQAMQNVSKHLSACAVCSQLVAEYSASQAWLRTYDVPEFDDAFFRDLKQSVMQEIEQKQPRPSLLQSLRERWRPNLAFAMALVMLILVGAFVFSKFKGGSRIEPIDTRISEEGGHQEEPRRKENQPVVETPEQHLMKRHPVKHHRRPLQPKPAAKIIDEPLPMVSQQSIEPLDSLAINIFDSPLTLTPVGLNERAGWPTPAAGMRIEFQTSDPNIRIIWFAPKTNSSQSSKIDAE
jgi:hypothetical protein